MSQSPVAILAGTGSLPLLAAKKFKQRDRRVNLYSLTSTPHPELHEVVDHFNMVEPERFGTVPRMLSEDGVKEVLLVGDVDKKKIFDQKVHENADAAVKRQLDKLKDKGDDEIIRAAARMLKFRGLRVLGVNEILADQLTPAGHIAGPEPSEYCLATLTKLSSLAVKLVDEEVGQAVTGKEQTVVAVEGVEGTSQLIRRSSRLAGDGLVLLKIARSSQDYRFDVPVVGLETVRLLTQASADLLAVEADVTLFLQQDECFQLAEENELSIMGWQRPSTSVFGRLKKWFVG